METRWTSTTKLLVLICFLIVGAWVLLQFSQIIPPLLIAFILAYLLKPPTDWLVRRTGWPRGLAIIVLFILLLAILIVTPILATSSLASIISSIQLDTSGLEPLFNDLNGQVFQLGPIQINGSVIADQLVQGLQAVITPFASGAFQFVSGIASSLFWILFVIVAIFWLLKDSYKLEGWIIEHISPSYRQEFNHLLAEMGVIWGSFFRGELVLAIVMGALVGTTMWILGLPNILLLALFSAFGEFVPTIGPVVAAIPAILMAVFTGSSWLNLNPILFGLIVAIIYTLIFQFEQLYLLPRIVGRRVKLHPAVVFVGTIIGATQIGLLGVLIAAPVIATARLFGGYIYRKMLDIEPFASLPGAEVTAIEWRGMIRGQAIAGVLFDLDGTIIDTDDNMVARLAAKLGPFQRIFPNGDARPFVRHLLLLAESPINGLITRFDRFDLDDEAFRANTWLRDMLGYRRPTDMTLIPGVAETLGELTGSYKLALVTTRSRAETDFFLKLTGLTTLFEVIITRDDVRRLKPHPEPLLLAMERLGLGPERCAMVGDTSVDVRSARAAGAKSVAVLCGFGERRDLEEADLILNSTADLTTWL